MDFDVFQYESKAAAGFYDGKNVCAMRSDAKTTCQLNCSELDRLLTSFQCSVMAQNLTIRAVHAK